MGRRFRTETGASLAGWIALRRVERARALLEDSELTVSGVAPAVGFGSTEAMRRHFAAQTGTTPHAYRATFRGSRSTTRQLSPTGTTA